MSRSKKGRPLKTGASSDGKNSSGSSQFTLQRLIESCPIQRGNFPSNIREFLEKTGLSKGLVCLGDDYWNCETEFLGKFRKPLIEMGVVVPAPMKSRYGKKAKSDDLSQRTNSNTGPLRFVVVALKVGSVDEQARSILELKRSAPLAAVVQRNPEHIEGWFSTKGWNLEKITRFRTAARNLGAPKDIFINCQPYSLPGGWNLQDQCRQCLIYWNPGAL